MVCNAIYLNGKAILSLCPQQPLRQLGHITWLTAPILAINISQTVSSLIIEGIVTGSGLDPEWLHYQLIWWQIPKDLTRYQRYCKNLKSCMAHTSFNTRLTGLFTCEHFITSEVYLNFHEDSLWELLEDVLLKSVGWGVSSAWWCASTDCELCKTVFKLAVWSPLDQPGTTSLVTEVATCDTFGLILMENMKGLLHDYKNVNGNRANMMYIWHHGA